MQLNSYIYYSYKQLLLRDICDGYFDTNSVVCLSTVKFKPLYGRALCGVGFWTN